MAHASGSGWVQTVGAVVAGLAPARSRRPGVRSARAHAHLRERPPPTRSPARRWSSTSSATGRCAAPRGRSAGTPLLLTRRIPARLVIVPPPPWRHLDGHGAPRHGRPSRPALVVTGPGSRAPPPALRRAAATRTARRRHADDGRAARTGDDPPAADPHRRPAGACAPTSTATGGAGCTGMRAPTPGTSWSASPRGAPTTRSGSSQISPETSTPPTGWPRTRWERSSRS